MPRFLSVVPDERLLDLALVLWLMLRGVPCLFYGTEQYLRNDTNGGQDPYNRPMMESWDDSSCSFVLVKTLVSRSEGNQPLAFSAHQTAWVNKSFWLCTCNLRDSAVVVLNCEESDYVADVETI